MGRLFLSSSEDLGPGRESGTSFSLIILRPMARE